jgi:hypothetical protein
MRSETVGLMVAVFTVCTMGVVLAMLIGEKPQDPEWYKYKVSVVEDKGIIYYEVEGWDGEMFGVVRASELDSLISEINR